jgi:oligopeptide/dipeptide ABC transporter ATP-binding protein
MAETLLSVRNLTTTFSGVAGRYAAVDGVSLDVPSGQTLCLVGESGSGKSVTALSIMQLVPSPPGQIVGGEIWFKGRNLLSLPADELRQVRGSQIAMIFQEPMTALNPLQRVGRQIAEPMVAHRGLSWKEAEQRAVELLRRVGIPDPASRARSYPHELSGGMRQRVAIAMALGCDPQLLIADEPTTALDVTIQAQIIELLKELQDQTGMAILLITHDLGLVAEMADSAAVMYAGRIVETGSVETLFERPSHPYSLGLLRSMPAIDRDQDRLEAIEGIIPSPNALPGGCRFHPRCPFAAEPCREIDPELRERASGQHSACLRANELEMLS